jgi:hypothetical protein
MIIKIWADAVSQTETLTLESPSQRTFLLLNVYFMPAKCPTPEEVR